MPLETRNEENIRVFTEVEAFTDLVQNGKYNKKNSKTIQDNIKNFKMSGFDCQNSVKNIEI